MQNQFKPGDLALVVGCVRNPQYIGRTVELIEWLSVGARSRWKSPVTGNFQTNADDAPGWLVETISTSGAILVAPHHLMPLKGTETPQLEKQKEVERDLLP